MFNRIKKFLASLCSGGLATAGGDNPDAGVKIGQSQKPHKFVTIEEAFEVTQDSINSTQRAIDLAQKGITEIIRYRKRAMDAEASLKVMAFEKRKRGELLEQIGSKLGMTYPLENRECIISRIDDLKNQLEAAADAFALIECITHDNKPLFVNEIKRIHTIAQVGYRAAQKPLSE